jgi:hypothetical protein
MGGAKMATAQQQQAFLTEMLPEAHAVSVRTGVDVEVLLAQSAVETGWGTSPAFVEGKNPAGISPGGELARYPSLAAGCQAWGDVLLEPAYADVRQAASADAQAVALGQSPWAASHYAAGDQAGGLLLAVVHATVAPWLSRHALAAAPPVAVTVGPAGILLRAKSTPGGVILTFNEENSVSAAEETSA